MTHRTMIPWLRGAVACVVAGSMAGACALEMDHHAVIDDGTTSTLPPAGSLRPAATRAGRFGGLRELPSTIEEWHRPHPAGIEHGFTLAESPSGEGEVVVEVAFPTGMRPTLDPTGNVVLRDARGRRVGHYTNLYAFDAEDRALPSWMTIEGERVLLHVDDRGARYPVTIDPLMWGNAFPLVPSDWVSGDVYSDMDVDGNTAVVLSPNHQHGGTEVPTIFVFVKNGGSWSQQAEILLPFPAGSGRVVQVSGDAIAVTHLGGSSLMGELLIYERSGTTWSHAATFAKPVGVDLFGLSLDLEGNTVVVGAPRQGTFAPGAAVVYIKTGAAWSHARTILNPEPPPWFGFSVALEDPLLVVGEPYAPNPVPSAWGVYDGRARVFRRPHNGTWADPPVDYGLIYPPNFESMFIQGAEYGKTMSFEGGHLLVGAPDYFGGAIGEGVVYAYEGTVNGGLVPRGFFHHSDPNVEQFGRELAVDGIRAFVGHTPIGPELPLALVFDQGSWTPMPELPQPPFVSGTPALAVSGTTALMTGHDGTVGSAYAWELNGSLGDPCNTAAECLSGECVDGVCCDAVCGGACESCTLPNTYGQCTSLAAADPGDPTCSPYLCDGSAGSCPAQCNVDSDCVADHFCDANACTPKGALADPCATPNGCLSTLCVDGLCCATACDGLCEACDVVGHEGGCWPVPAGGDPSNECADGACNGAGVCAADLGIPCTVAGDCLSGFCVDGLCCDGACDDACEACDLGGSEGSCAPVPGASDPADECPDGACDGAGACKLDLGQACVAANECFSGFCADGVCCGAACGDDDTDCQACSVAAGAAVDGTCAPLAAGTVCREADAVCGGEESCDGTSPDCPTDLAAPDGTPCDDDDACTSDDSCQSGQCEGGEDICSEPEGGSSAEGGAGGTGGAASFDPPADGGCGCRTAPSPARKDSWWPMLALGLVLSRRSRRPSVPTRA